LYSGDFLKISPHLVYLGKKQEWSEAEGKGAVL
jgi:hypothetical protein